MQETMEFARKSSKRGKRKKRGPVRASTRKKISRALTGRDGDGDGRKKEGQRNRGTASRRGMQVAAVGATGAAVIGGAILAKKWRGQAGGVSEGSIFSGGKRSIGGSPTGNSQLLAPASGSGASSYLPGSPRGGNIVKSSGGALVKRGPLSSSLAVKSQTSRVTDLAREVFNPGKSQSDASLTVTSGGSNAMTTNGVPSSSSFQAVFKSGGGKIGSGAGKLADRAVRNGVITGNAFREGYAGKNQGSKAYKAGNGLVKGVARLSGGAVGLTKGLKTRYNRRKNRK